MDDLVERLRLMRAAMCGILSLSERRISTGHGPR